MGTKMTRRQVIATGAAVAGSAALTATVGADAAAATTARRGGSGGKDKPTIVLVHGGYADPSCWNDVIAKLQHDGYTTMSGSNPSRGIPTDAQSPASGALVKP